MQRRDLPAIDFPYAYARRRAATLAAELRAMGRRERDPDALAAYQRRALRRLVRHACQTCPYYADLFATAGVHPNQIAGPPDLARLPILTRQALQRHFLKLCSDRADLAQCVVRRTSGSTGAPVRFLLSTMAALRAQITLLHMAGAYGLTPAHFGPQQTGLLSVTAFPASRSYTFQQPGMGMSQFVRLNLNAAAPDPLALIDALQPVMLTGLPEHLLALGKMIAARGAAPSHPWPRLALASGNHLHTADKAALEAAFAAPVADLYASGEAGYIAIACPVGGGYHISDGLLLEVVRPDGAACAPGETGEILITGLHGFEMPLIRYQIGDRGCLAPAGCPCGSARPRLAAIEGRSVELFVRPDGARLHPFTFLKELKMLSALHYQVVQRSQTEVVVRYVAADDAAGLADAITACLQRALGEDIQVVCEQVEQIGAPGRKIHSFVSLVEQGGIADNEQ